MCYESSRLIIEKLNYYYYFIIIINNTVNIFKGIEYFFNFHFSNKLMKNFVVVTVMILCYVAK